MIVRYNTIIPFHNKKVSEYDQEIPQSQTADNPMTAPNHHETPGSNNKQKVNNRTSALEQTAA